MAIIRIKHTENYVVIHKSVLENPRLSFKAKGLWAYGMSRPNDWEFNVEHLSKVSKDGTDSVYSALKELIDEGYCQKVQQNIKGKFCPVDYIIYETQDELKKCLPLRDFPYAGFPYTVNPALLSIEEELSNEKEIKGEESPPAPVISKRKVKSETKERAPKVFTSDEQHTSLISKAGNEEMVTRCYQKLSDYKIANPNYKKNDYLCIVRWVLNSIKDQPIKPKDEDLAKIIKEEFGSKVEGQIEFGYNYVEFVYIPGAHYQFGEAGFTEKVLNGLRKMNLAVTKIEQKLLHKN